MKTFFQCDTKRMGWLLYYLFFRCLPKNIYYKNNFKDIRTVILTIGFNRSGSSLMSSLLTAHPNIVFADDVQYSHRFKAIHDGRKYLLRIYNGNLNKLFSIILAINQMHYQRKISLTFHNNKTQQKPHISRSGNRNKRFILVPNQYQGSFKRLKVIGSKSSIENQEILLTNDTLANLRRKLKEKDIKLKFLFTVRNPYDIVARIKFEHNFSEEEFLQILKRRCENSEKILKKIDPQDLFVNRHEDMLKDPRRQLARLCDFLQVPIPTGYIEDCVSVILQEPYKSRLDINWSPKLKQAVALMNEKYDFFSAYDYES